MEIKFNCRSGVDNYIDIEGYPDEGTIYVGMKRKGEPGNFIWLDKNDLYSLIGQLLRLQAEMKKEANNG